MKALTNVSIRNAEALHKAMSGSVRLWVEWQAKIIDWNVCDLLNEALLRSVILTKFFRGARQPSVPQTAAVSVLVAFQAWKKLYGDEEVFAERDRLLDAHNSIEEMSAEDHVALKQTRKKKTQLEDMLSRLLKNDQEAAESTIRSLKG